MSSKTGVGFSSKTGSFEAGAECSARALASLGDLPISMVLVFCNGKHDPHHFLAGVRSVTGHAPLIGGAAMGVFTNDDLSYEAYESAATLISSDSITFKTFSQGGLDKNEYDAGAALAEQVNLAATARDRALLVFYDTAKAINPPRLNFATPLFAAIEAKINPDVVCVGGGLMGDLTLTSCFQFLDDKVLNQHVTGLLIGGDCRMYNTIMHGCKPASSYKTITRAEGPVVYEIDGKPAIDVIDELFGQDHKVPWNEFPLFVTLGLNKGDKFGDFNPVNYANRVCLAIDPVQKALIMFEPDLKAGDEVQLMHRSINLDYIHTGIELLQQKAIGKPLFYFYINCGGRAKPFAGGELEDAAEVQKLIGKDTAFMGFYSGVEVAKLGDHLQALDWTGVLCLITEES